MTITYTQNLWTVNLNQYEPVLLDANEALIMRAGFSLAEEAEDSGKRLHLLIDFIEQARRVVSSAHADLGADLSVSVSQNVVEQIIYLAYWKNYRLQFGIENTGESVVIRAQFLNQPGLNCILDQFETEDNNQEALQGWLDFLCTIISDHADIWQIHFVIHESIYAKFTIPTAARVFVEVGRTEGQPVQRELPALAIASC
jgi:hypothetical protein